jgi:hypothetical protein
MRTKICSSKKPQMHIKETPVDLSKSLMKKTSQIQATLKTRSLEKKSDSTPLHQRSSSSDSDEPTLMRTSSLSQDGECPSSPHKQRQGTSQETYSPSDMSKERKFGLKTSSGKSVKPKAPPVTEDASPTAVAKTLMKSNGMISIEDLERIEKILYKRHSRSAVNHNKDSEITETIPGNVSQKKVKLPKKYLDDDPEFDSNDVVEDKTSYEPATSYKGIVSAHRVKDDPVDIAKQQEAIMKKYGLHLAPEKPPAHQKYRYAFV